MSQIETELIKNSDYEEKITELEKINHQLNCNLTETKALVNDNKFKQINTFQDINDLW